MASEGTTKQQLMFGVDIDGTITAAPIIFAALMKSLVDAGHVVVVITGALNDSPISLSARTNQLRYCEGHLEPGIHYHELIICQGNTVADVAKKKGTICRELGVDFMFEDSTDYARWIRTYSNKTAVALIQP